MDIVKCFSHIQIDGKRWLREVNFVGGSGLTRDYVRPSGGNEPGIRPLLPDPTFTCQTRLPLFLALTLSQRRR